MAILFNHFILSGAIVCVLCYGSDGGNILCKTQNHSIQGNELSVNSSETVSLNCSIVQGGPARQITWTKKGTTVSSQRLFTVSSASVPGLWSSLRLSNITVDDSGTYQCEVKKNGKRDVCYVVLHVYSPPRILTTKGFFTTTPQIMSEGRNPVFHCYASGWPTPSFTWLKDGTEIQDGDAEHSYVLTERANGLDSGLDLDILYVRQKHAGQYSCVARNRFGKEQHHINLFLEKKYPGKPPKVHPYASKHQVIIPRSGDALLACVGENTPDRDTFVFWVFNGTSLPLDNNEDLHHKSDFEYFQEQQTLKVNFSLLIRNVTERDTGAYHCGVRTLKGNDSDTIYLSLVKPDSQHGRQKASLTEILLVCVGIFCGLVMAAIAHRQWSRRRKHWKHELPSEDFQYDVFISFSTLDYNWVRDNLTPVLERKRINYCIHSRDFIVGKAIIENIADSVYNSRKVLAIISHNYLSSHFCREELEIALYRCTEMADSSLLLIRVDHVDKDRLPKTLRRRTFLDYASALERMDWERRLLKHIEFDDKNSTQLGSPSASTVQLLSEQSNIKRV